MRLALYASAVGLALTVSVVGSPLAQASGIPAPQPATRSVTGPVKAVGQTTPMAFSPSGALAPDVRRHSASGNTDDSNWAGYVASGYFTSVTSKWTVPETYCTSRGEAVFWVGLDGYTSSTVEQTGTGVNCSTGTPSYFAWWETYPVNAVQPYTNVVEPGDSIVSSVTYTGGTYQLFLQDVTERWQQDTTVAAPPGSANSSAEIIAEAPTVNGAISTLPNFGSADFSASTIDSGSLQAVNAQAFDIANSSGSVVAMTSGHDTTGDFNVSFNGAVSGTYEDAYENNAGYLSDYSVLGGAINLNQRMTANYTSPSITAVSGGHEFAFQTPSGNLSVYGTAGNVNTTLGMMADTSPSITTQVNGSYVVAFQANTGYLWIYTPSAGGVQIPLGMMAGTSPSIAALANGGYIVAFQANTGALWTYSPSAGGTLVGLGMAAGTSPSVTGTLSGSYTVAFQANTGYLWTYAPSTGGVQTPLGMAAGTSPSITLLFNGGTAVAYTANTGYLWVYSPATGAIDLNEPISQGSSPAIAEVPTGYEVAYQYLGGTALSMIGSLGATDSGQGMPSYTSPAIAGTTTIFE